MKISVKIVMLTAILLGILAIDGIISHGLLKRMGNELQVVVNKDMVLIQSATAITRFQLQKAVVFERVRRIIEELNYQTTTSARMDHLLFHLNLAKTNLDNLAREGAQHIVNAKMLIDEGLKIPAGEESRKKLLLVSGVLREIETAHIHYDSLLGNLFSSVLAGNYDIPLDDLDQIHRDEKKLGVELQNLIDAVSRFTHESLGKSETYQKTAERILWITFLISFLAATLLCFSIIYSILDPLKTLVAAAKQIGRGNLDVNLARTSRDEFGELSKTFNEMSRQLKESRKELEAQSDILRRNLEITDQQKADLELVNRELDRFVHTVSHDIRSPLMGIAWYADFLKKQYFESFDQKGKDSLLGVCKGVDRCNILIKDLLALTRITRVRNPYQESSAARILDEVIATLDYKIKENRVDLRISSDMPLLVCDPIKLKEVFLNLLTNAIKFSSGSDVQPVVEFGFLERLDEYEFFVKDNGIGIPEKYHDEIFTIFHRLDTSEKYEGTGAGLSIVKNIVEDHKGRVWVVSSTGKGAEFHFTISRHLTVKTT